MTAAPSSAVLGLSAPAGAPLEPDSGAMREGGLFSSAVRDWRGSLPSTLSKRYLEDVWRLTEGWLAEWKSSPGPKEVFSYAQRRAGEVGYERQARERGLLRAFGAWARTMGHVEHEGSGAWPRPRRTAPPRAPVVLSAEAESALLGALAPELVSYVRFCLYTGLRQGTARALRWEHVTPDGLRVPASLMKSRRALEVPLAEQALLALPPRGTGLVWKALPGPSLFAKRFAEAARRVGLRPVPTPHDLRKTFATRLLDRGVAPAMVMRLGGWSSLAVLLRHYTGPAGREAAAEALRRL